MRMHVRGLLGLAAVAGLAGCAGGPRSVSLPAAASEPVAVSAVRAQPSAGLPADALYRSIRYSGRGAIGYGSAYPGYGGPIEGGLSLAAFVAPFVEPHGDGNFADSGAGWGMEAGIYTGAQPGNAFLSVMRADLDEPAAGVETPYWIVDAGIRVPIGDPLTISPRPIVAMWGSGFSYHRFARPQTDDLWGFGVFALLGAAWLPAPNFYLGADGQAHVWFPEEGQGGTTFMATVGATVLF